jgi:hypothetical protein
MNAHTFVVPPFFVTTGSHYIKFRTGSNILRGMRYRSKRSRLMYSKKLRYIYCYYGITTRCHQPFTERLPVYVSFNTKGVYAI